MRTLWTVRSGVASDLVAFAYSPSQVFLGKGLTVPMHLSISSAVPLKTAGFLALNTKETGAIAFKRENQQNKSSRVWILS